ncbi:MAG: transglutaminase-like domain-containing protein [Collinsella sp.]
MATLAFRSQGIPARYVEGYRASGERIARAHRSGSALNLTAADAHAWTEVYLDGQGWTPIEVTPGYYSQTLDADKIVDVGEAWSNGTDDSTLDVGAVAGKAEKSAIRLRLASARRLSWQGGGRCACLCRLGGARPACPHARIASSTRTGSCE